ncbi:MAG: glutamine--fructose-6-phosphate transaminase (isomerizing) [Gammaproteobacteria bacterium]|nr:glutamine--fructose-6-phosphate transaminase (isomerizing) [Gammaproteobacteria bacterium]NIR83285.1 glutamine--fructose-6-phosphate transaminase (isomerizing) [Gammaproteobacteria bacterium]NIR91085.1 glutamine--fructose-6-phosphate transaminase (isomerizing) [Gammaproteobacteria bacterium]NIU04452.1 glutamine--fructose-6-phosphate transaminase (isomerizing) [Gammaproteobacteria bacterium]NIW87088.1 glutamine--fructose-6-phosphate transaminase (isomerizing) [Gammaproteobacteria bacterium]
MCGIVGAVAERDVVPILLDGLKRLEYRGYDSAGVAVVNGEAFARVRTCGKVAKLAELIEREPPEGFIGIAHTRWATHGEPTTENAHPQVVGDSIAVVHNGIIENYVELRERLRSEGYAFGSDTDTEVIANLVLSHVHSGCDVFEAVRRAVRALEGAYAIGVIHASAPHRLIGARVGPPLVVGVGAGEYFLASDIAALIAVTQQFVILEQGDVVELTHEGAHIVDVQGRPQKRKTVVSQLTTDAVERGEYRHYMQKEIFEQPYAIANTLQDRLGKDRVLESAFGERASEIFDRVRAVQIIACGTSYHAGMVARNWFEGLAGIPCHVEVASEFRYRHPVPPAHALTVAISQSGETADTLAALHYAKELGYGASLGIVNAPESSLVRESDLVLMTRAGPEIGVASTKAFTTQLVVLLMLVCVLGRRGKLSAELEARIVRQLRTLPQTCERVLGLDADIERLSARFADKGHALFLGRGVQYPVAMEGALKLKEISYIHAEAYPAGELKHGPLALVDAGMPVVAVAPNDALLEKLKSNLEEVRARGGELYVFADAKAGVRAGQNVHVMEVPASGENVAPIIYTIPLQLLAYHVAVLKGTDVDQPRNLAKSVTVE